MTDFRAAFLKTFILKSFPVVLSNLEGAFDSHVLKITRALDEMLLLMAALAQRMLLAPALSAIVDE